ncbi:MAG: ATP-binding protein [Desulfobacteraceae bacterium]|nr:ATP-binding protein [Desulfobacteraceae bacterium]
MIEKSFDSIKKEDIDALLQRQVREKRTMEYKRTLPDDSDEQKREFLADVSSFANAAGGDILYGISEDDGIPKEIVGLQGGLDAEVLRIENIIRTSVAPRMPAIHIKPIEGFSNGGVILIRVGKSWAAPHMVTFRNLSRFFTRNSAGKYQMDVAELRSAFLLSDSVAEKIKQFRGERVSRIVSGEMPIQLDGPERLILHVIPVSAFTSKETLDINSLLARDTYLPPLYASGYNKRINLDGLMTYSEKQSYCQVYRSGIIETVTTDFMYSSETGPMIPSVHYEADIIQKVAGYAHTLSGWEVPAPYVIAISMLGVRGAKMALGPNYLPIHQNKIDRNDMILPDVLLEGMEMASDNNETAKLLRPIFDVVWNACGYPKSLNYDDNGNWKHKWQ